MEYYRPVFEDLARLESFDKIVGILDTITPVLPKTVQAYDLVCYGYYKAKKYVNASEYGEKALAATDSSEGKQSIRFNLAKCYQYANQPDKALNLLKLNTLSNPKDIDSRIDYCVAMYAQGKKAEAGALLRDMLKEELPEKARDIVNFNLGAHDLREGKFKEGMKRLLTGRKLTIWGSSTHNFPIPKWDGTPVPGKKILIIGEGGIGDEFINMRFAQKFIDIGMIPSWASAHGLADVIRKCSDLPYENVLNYKNFTTDIPSIKDYDFWTPGMDVPAMLELDRDDVWVGPYLKAPTQTVQPVKKSKLRIGIRWSGNPLYEQDLHRTIPIHDIVKMLKETIEVPFELYSFQKGPGEEDLETLPDDIINIAPLLRTFSDTIQALDSMDLVISSCTSVPHAAAAMGVETVVMTPIMSYYTWAEETNKSPWYGDNLTLIRQHKPKDWSGAIEDLRQYVSKYKIGQLQ